MNTKLGKRILFIGCPASGKSTLSKQVKEITGLPLTHLDAVYHKANWKKIPKDEWEKKLADLLAGEEWILDGNYNRTMPLRFNRADTIVLLDYNTKICLERMLKRREEFKGKKRDDVAEGCDERDNPEFTKLIENFRKEARPRIYKLLKEYKNGRSIIILKSPKATEKWLKKLEDNKKQA